MPIQFLTRRTPGVADYYCAEVPRRYGLLSEAAWLEAWNDELSSYYTNPCVGWSNDEAYKNGWKNAHAQELPYKRGAVYLLRVDAQIRRATEGKRSLDPIVLALLRRKETGVPPQRADFLRLLHDELGEEGLAEFNAMLDGALVQVPPNVFGDDYSIVRQDREMLEIGWVKDKDGVLKDLKPHSRAEQAGLREGDRILSNTFFYHCSAKFDKNMVMLVKRGSEEVEVEYWPRSWHKVPCWLLVRARSGR